MRSLGTNDGPIRALTNEGGAHCQLIANNAVSSRPILRAYAQHSPCIVPCAVCPPLSLSLSCATSRDRTDPQEIVGIRVWINIATF